MSDDLDRLATLAHHRPPPGGPLPEVQVQALRALIDSLSSDEFDSAGTRFTGRSESVLNDFGYETAVRSVREGDPLMLSSGLRALALEYETGPDERDVLMTLSLLWHSCELLHPDAGAAFDAAADLSGRYGFVLRDFARRDPEDRSLECMGYVAAGQGATFDYEED